jgi:hypothetical protein
VLQFSKSILLSHQTGEKGAMAMNLWLASPALSQDEKRQEETYRLANQIRKKILTLSNYGVFDYIAFSLEPAATGDKVTLPGRL